MQISDDLQLGPVLTGLGNSAGPSLMEKGVGPMGRVYIFDLVPLALGTNNIATSQNPGSGASFTLTAGTGVTAVGDANGVTRYTFDCARCVSVIAAGANTATYKISGYDIYGQAMSQTIAAPSTSTVTTTKAFKSVTSVTNANATGTTNGVTVGTSDTIGLPYRLLSKDYITFNYNATVGLLAAVTAADLTSPATVSTGDTRGTIALASASDGVKRLVAFMAMPAIACGPNATLVGAIGVPQV